MKREEKCVQRLGRNLRNKTTWKT